MSRGVGLDAGRQDVELGHGGVEAVGIVLCHIHRFELLEACLLGDFVLALVGVVLQVAHVGDVADVAHLIADVAEVAEQEVEGDGRTGVAQVGVAIDGGAADVHADVSLVDGDEGFFLARERVVYL